LNLISPLDFIICNLFQFRHSITPWPTRASAPWPSSLAELGQGGQGGQAIIPGFVFCHSDFGFDLAFELFHLSFPLFHHS